MKLSEALLMNDQLILAFDKSKYVIVHDINTRNQKVITIKTPVNWLEQLEQNYVCSLESNGWTEVIDLK